MESLYGKRKAEDEKSLAGARGVFRKEKKGNEAKVSFDFARRLDGLLILRE